MLTLHSGREAFPPTEGGGWAIDRLRADEVAVPFLRGGSIAAVACTEMSYLSDTLCICQTLATMTVHA
jgi:hypothetical protein